MQAVLRRKWSIFALACLAALGTGVVVSQIASDYTAHVAVAVDARRLRVINAESVLSADLLDREQLRTEMEPIGGIALARQVVAALSLNHDPVFCASLSQPSPLAIAAGVFRRPPPRPRRCAVPAETAARALLGRVSAHNDGTSYVIDIAATAGSPDLAAAIANEYAQRFIDDRQAESAAVSTQAAAWLNTYSGQLRDEVATADAAVAQYEASHGLTLVHGGTLTAQTLLDMNAQLSQITGEIAQHRGAAPVADSPVLDGLLAKSSELGEQESRLRAEYSGAHPDVLAIKAARARLAQQITAEEGRSASRAAAELAVLEQRRAALVAQVAGLQAQIGSQGKADVRLSALQREAEARRQVYQSVLSRRMEIAAQQGLQPPDSRVAAEALPPIAPSGPHRAMLVIGAFLAAATLGSLIAIGASLLSRRFRDLQHLEAEIGLPVLGVFPRPVADRAPQNLPLDRPGSPEAEAILRILPKLLHAAAESATQSRRGQTLVITSALPGEGKTSFALALGHAATQFGLSAIVVDCDVRRPAVTRLIGRPESADATSQAPLAHISLPSAMSGRPRFITEQDVRRVMADLTPRYDLVLLDAPPILVLADALTVAAAGAQVLLVVDWLTTPRRAVAACCQILQRQGAHLIGVVASKVDLRRDADAMLHRFHYEAEYFDASATR